MKKYDLAVIGGGFAGVAAALAAARAGVKVLIVEKSNCLGGAAVNCLVNPFMPYWTEVDGKRVDFSAGIFREIHDRLEARNAMRKESFLFILSSEIPTPEVYDVENNKSYSINQLGEELVLSEEIVNEIWKEYKAFVELIK